MSQIPSNIQAAVALSHLAGQARARDTRPARETKQSPRALADVVDLKIGDVEHENAVRELKDNLQEDTREDREANPQTLRAQTPGERPALDVSA